MLLVDNVDDRPVVVGTLGVGGSAPASIEEFLGRDPALMVFVKCDVSLPEDVFRGRAHIRRRMQRTLDERSRLMAGPHGLRDVPLEPLPR